MKKCAKCLEDKELSEFSKNKRQKDGLSRICKACMATEQSRSYHKNKTNYIQREKEYLSNKKEKLDSIKSSCGCEKCKDVRPYVLVFHHIDPSQKEFEVSSKLKNYNWETLMKEISKCKILCHNCHYEFHYLERTQNLTIEEYLK